MRYKSTGLRSFSVFGSHPLSVWQNGLVPFLVNQQIELDRLWPTASLDIPEATWVAPVISSNGKITVLPVLHVSITLDKLIDYGPKFYGAIGDTRRGLLITPGEQRELIVTCEGQGVWKPNVLWPTSFYNGYLIPMAVNSFQLLPLLLLERSPSVSGGCEWRNWEYSNGVMRSYRGNVHGDILPLPEQNSSKAEAWREIDFWGHISPLANGVVGSLQVFHKFGGDASAYIYVSRDSSNHVLAQAGLDRCTSANSGLTVPFQCGFAIGQKLWVRVLPDCVGRIEIHGWLE